MFCKAAKLKKSPCITKFFSNIPKAFVEGCADTKQVDALASTVVDESGTS